MKKLIIISLFLPILAFSNIVLIKNGKSDARILYDMQNSNVNKALIFNKTPEDCAVFLADYIKKSTDLTIPVSNKANASDARGVQIELEIAPASKKMNLQDFHITFPSSNRIVITGGSPRGLEYGVYEFLERCFGVRWLFPSDLGTEIPKHKNIVIPRKTIKQSPSFEGRALSSGGHTVKHISDCYQWDIHNKGSLSITSKISTGHYLNVLVPVAEYGKSNPEFYPILNNKRYIPTRRILWQPCMTAKGLAEKIAAKLPPNAIVSLGINDGGGHCECTECIKLDGSRKNFLNIADRTRSYLLFANKLAELRPDVTFGILAYLETVEPAIDVKLRDNVRVRIAYETQQLVDPARRAKIEKLVQNWKKVTSQTMGWYDYLYGSNYCLPRVFPKFLSDTMKWMYKNNIRDIGGEYFPNGNWQDALKIYVMHKTAWDVNTDVNSIIDDWCKNAVGEKAAPYLKAYFARLEKFWTSQEITKTQWFNEWVYLPASSSTFLDAMPESMIAELEDLLVKTHKYSTNKARSNYFLVKYRQSIPNLKLYKKNQKMREKASRMTFDKTILNSNFDKNIDKWYVWQELKEYGKSFHSTNGGINNSPALCHDMTNGITFSRAWKREIDVTPGNIYKITVRSKTDQIDVGGKVGIRASYRKNDKWMDYSLSSADSYTVNEKQNYWHETILYSTAPADPHAKMVLILSAVMSSHGKIYFDDIKVETLKKMPSNF